MKRQELLTYKDENVYRTKLKFFNDCIIQVFWNLKNSLRTKIEFISSLNILKVKVFTLSYFNKKLLKNSVEQFHLKKIEQKLFSEKFLMQYHICTLKMLFTEISNWRIFWWINRGILKSLILVSAKNCKPCLLLFQIFVEPRLTWLQR